jgi:hypothetical protein
MARETDRHRQTDRQGSEEAGAVKQAGGQTHTCRSSGRRLVDSCLAPSKCTFELEHSTQHTRKHAQSLPLITHACTHKLRIKKHKLTRTQFLSGNVLNELFDVGEDLVAVRLGARVRLQLLYLCRVIDSGFDLKNIAGVRFSAGKGRSEDSMPHASASACRCVSKYSMCACFGARAIVWRFHELMHCGKNASTTSTPGDRYRALAPSSIRPCSATLPAGSSARAR